MSRAQQNGRAYDKMVKILLIGNSGVGKSSILLQYSDKKFAHNYYNTIGVDYRIKYTDVKDQRIKVQVWDTAGQDRFKTITSSYYRGADAIIIVFDVSDRQSYDNVKNWLQEIQKYVDEKTFKYIIGNKCDLDYRRQVETSEAEQMAKKLMIPFKETSARLATNVEDVFEEIIGMILDKDGGSSYPSKNSRSHIELPSPRAPSNNEKKSSEKVSLKEMLEKKKEEEQGSCCTIY